MMGMTALQPPTYAHGYQCYFVRSWNMMLSPFRIAIPRNLDAEGA